jgi:hypothetical protein
MNRNFAQEIGFAREWRRATLTATLVLLGAIPWVCQAAPPPSASPVGTWDIVSSGGGQQGLAYLTFTTDPDSLGNYTFHGYVLVAGTRPVVAATNSSSDGRNAGGADSRGGSSSSTNTSSTATTTASTTLFGFTDISGPWRYGNDNRIMGFFTELINVSSNVTNYLATNVLETISNASNPSEITNILVAFADAQSTAVTNYSWPTNGQWYVFNNPNMVVVEGSAEMTNAISFVGKAVAGKRLTLVSSTSFGRVNYTGIPAVALTDFSGSGWSGIKRANGQFFVEFFNMNSPDDAGYPNIYPVSGVGPGYSNLGHTMISAQKKIGFFFVANGVRRASVGSFSLNTKNGTAKASTKGIEDPGTSIRFDASLLSWPE